jgi:hypothetical protein
MDRPTKTEEVEITPEMVAAGASILRDLDRAGRDRCGAFAEEFAREIFVEMWRVRIGIQRKPSGLELNPETLEPLALNEVFDRQ